MLEINCSALPHEQGAHILLALRERKLAGLMGRNRYVGLIQTLTGHCAFLSDQVDPLDLSVGNLQLRNLCLWSLQETFHAGYEAVLERLVAEQLLDDPNMLFDAIDIVGTPTWQHLLQLAVQSDQVPWATRWPILARFAPLLTLPGNIQANVSNPLQPDQLTAVLRHATLPVDIAVDLASKQLDHPDLQEDFLWLAMHLNKQHESRLPGFLAEWREAIASNDATCWQQAVIATRATGFSETLHRQVREQTLPASALAFHGQPEHTHFCLSLLSEPRYNAAGAELWSLLAGQHLPHIPRLADTANPQATSDDTLADHSAAQRRWQQLDNHQPLWGGRPFHLANVRDWALMHFGANSKPSLLTLWANQPDDFVLLPNEHPWQRRDTIGSLTL